MRDWNQISVRRFLPKSFIHIERHKNLNPVNGAILRESKAWVLIQNIEDFRIDGYNIIHKISIKKIRQDSSDKYYQGILENEKISENISDVSGLDIENALTILKSIIDLKIPAIIHCEMMGVWEFSIGFVEEMNSDEIKFRHYNPLGKIEKIRKIRMNHIDRVAIKENYIEKFMKYVQI